MVPCQLFELMVFFVFFLVSLNNDSIFSSVATLLDQFQLVGIFKLFLSLVVDLELSSSQVAAPPVTLGRAAAEIQLKKPTRIGDFCNAAPDFNGVLLFFSHYLFPLMRSARIPLFSQGALLGRYL